MTTQVLAIDPNKTLNQIIEEAPEALEVLHQFGFDTCCGGTTPLAIAAERHSLDLQTILQALAAQQQK